MICKCCKAQQKLVSVESDRGNEPQIFCQRCLLKRGLRLYETVKPCTNDHEHYKEKTQEQF